MSRVTLTTHIREAVQALHRDPSLSPAERERLEMILLSEEGWSPRRIAGHLKYHAKTVRLALDRFKLEGLSSVRHGRPESARAGADAGGSSQPR